MNKLIANLRTLGIFVVGKIIKVPEKILLGCSGASLKILNDSDSQCHSYKGVYMRLGGIILIISTFASISFGYAVFTILEAGSNKEMPLETQIEEEIISLQNEIDSLQIEEKDIKIKIENLKIPFNNQEINKLRKEKEKLEHKNQSNSIKGILVTDKLLSNLIISCVIGLLWGTLIFLIDGFIIGTTRKNIDPTHQIGTATITLIRKDTFVIAGRLILAAFVGYIISIPVEILAFKQEILAKIVEQDKKSNYENMKLIKKEAQVKYDKAYDNYHNFDTSGARVLKISKDSSEFKIKLLKTEIEKNRDYVDLKKAKIEDERCKSTRISCWTPNPGLMRLYKAIDGLDDKFLPWLIRFVFIFIDILPILTKISKKADNYDVALATNEFKKKIAFKLEEIKLNTEVEIIENKSKLKKEETQKISASIENKIEENINAVVSEIINSEDSKKNIVTKVKPIVMNYMIRLHEKYFSLQK
jgi:hypothetical protein